MSQTRESSRHLESLMKGLEVIDCIEQRPNAEATLTEIAEALGLYKSRVIRLCGTLLHMGYLVHDQQEKIYRLGPRLLSLGRAYERTNPLLLAVKPTLESLHHRLGATASFYILRGLRRICAAKVSSRQGWMRTSEGQERELHYGSAGKIFLAFGPQELRETFFSGSEPYTKLTPFTPITAKKVWEEVRKVREQGYAASCEERVMGFAGLAAPVFRSDGELVGALSVAGDAKDFNASRIAEMTPVLLEEAEALSKKLGLRDRPLASM